MKPTIEDIERMVALQLGRRSVAREHRIIEDLGAESIDVVNIVASVEDRYQITIEEVALLDIRTVKDLFDCACARVPRWDSSMSL